MVSTCTPWMCRIMELESMFSLGRVEPAARCGVSGVPTM